MNRNILGIGALLLAGTLAVPEAEAAVCLLRSSSGSCRLWSGSVQCEDLNATGIGNVRKTPKSMACSIAPPPNSGPYVRGLVYCSNGGGNVAPGVQAFGPAFGGITTITPAMVDRNGNVRGLFVKAEVPPDQMQPGSMLSSFCQNSNWYAIDFVPIEMDASVEVIDETTDAVVDSKTFTCSLPSWETLQWDKKAQRPERRQYNCVEKP